jgi:nucleoside-diphosphate-sugar epimerase
MSKKVLVTGVAGFIGSHLVKSLHALGYDVAGFVTRDGDDPAPRSDVPVIGRLRDLPGLIERHRIGEIIFSRTRRRSVRAM